MRLSFPTPPALTISTFNAIAQRDELKMHAEIHDAVEGALWVSREGETEHLVSPNPFGAVDLCGCEDHQQFGYCVHCAFAELTRELWRQEAEHEERSEAARFMEWCKLEKAITAGAFDGGDYLSDPFAA